MTNSFELILDTTGPVIALVIPTYTIPQIPTEMWIRANEPLAPIQEIYIVDAQGARHDLIFEFQGDGFRGIYNFHEVAPGICTIYARVRDDVNNLSPLISAAIHVRQRAQLDVDMDLKVREVQLESHPRQVELNSEEREVVTHSHNRPVDVSRQERQVEVNIR